MKKRLRKKTHRGEFKELGFVMTAEYDEKPDMESLCEFADQLMDKFAVFGAQLPIGSDQSLFVGIEIGRGGAPVFVPSPRQIVERAVEKVRKFDQGAVIGQAAKFCPADHGRVGNAALFGKLFSVQSLFLQQIVKYI